MEAEPLNEWVKKSLELANSQGYLDRLSQIYPSTIPPSRPLEVTVKKEIEHFHAQGDWQSLLKKLFELTRKGHPFPIEHPYASILRQKPKLIESNPQTFQQLGQIILSMKIEDIIRGCERPVDINRAMGSAFRGWLKRYFSAQGYAFLQESQFEKSRGPAFFDGPNAAILQFINKKLHISLDRGRDFLFKLGDKYVVGEARFLSTAGGSQTRDLLETINFVKSVKKHLIALAVVDGIVWFHGQYVRKLSRLEKDEYALSALLLKEFLESLR